MAEKITGITVDYDGNDPLLDVDTAIIDLLEDLNRQGRQRAVIALRHLIQAAKGVYGPWWVYEDDDTQREIEAYDYTARTILLVPREEETDVEPPTEPA